MKKRKPKLMNIIVLAKFSDDKVRQVICNKQQQLNAIAAIRCLQDNGTLHVLDEAVEGINWESDVNLSKK